MQGLTSPEGASGKRSRGRLRLKQVYVTGGGFENSD